MTNNPEDPQFEILLTFDTEDQEFARGVEVGMLWIELAKTKLPYTTIVHANNAEMILRIAESLNIPVHSKELGEDWLEVTYG